MVQDSHTNGQSRALSKAQIASLPEAQRAAYLSLFLDGQRGRAQIRNAPRLGGVTAKIVKPLSKKFGPGTGALKRQWPEIVGEKFARLSRPGRLQGSKYGRVLTIEAMGPAAALISADATRIKERINRFLGEGYIAKLKFVQTGQSFTRPTPEMSKPEMSRPQGKGLTPNQEDRLRKSLEGAAPSGLNTALEAFGKIVGRQVLSRNSSPKNTPHKESPQ